MVIRIDAFSLHLRLRHDIMVELICIYICMYTWSPRQAVFLNGCLAKQPFLSSKDLESFNRKKHSFWSGYIRFQVWYCKCSMHHMNAAFFGASSRRLKSFHHFTSLETTSRFASKGTSKRRVRCMSCGNYSEVAATAGFLQLLAVQKMGVVLQKMGRVS